MEVNQGWRGAPPLAWMIEIFSGLSEGDGKARKGQQEN